MRLFCELLHNLKLYTILFLTISYTHLTNFNQTVDNDASFERY